MYLYKVLYIPYKIHRIPYLFGVFLLLFSSPLFSFTFCPIPKDQNVRYFDSKIRPCLAFYIFAFFFPFLLLGPSFLIYYQSNLFKFYFGILSFYHIAFVSHLTNYSFTLAYFRFLRFLVFKLNFEKFPNYTHKIP